MLKLDNVRVYNIKHALKGARNPLESWERSDSIYDNHENLVTLGENDRKLITNLVLAGSDHRKFLRQIFVSMEITAPMSWWWDFDTYKVATVRNSTSRMHKLGTRLLTPEDFSWDGLDGVVNITPYREFVLQHLNSMIGYYQTFKETDPEHARKIWREIILDLPESYNFMSTWTGNYENLRNAHHSRKNHKQREFPEFCREVEKLPLSFLITD